MRLDQAPDHEAAPAPADDGTRIATNDPKVRQGLDDQFHICIGASGALLCFYKPLRGF